MPTTYEGLTPEQSAQLDADDKAGKPVNANLSDGKFNVAATPTPPAASLDGFDWAAARKAGYSDTEILSGLDTKKMLPFDLSAARKTGYTDPQIVSGLASWKPPKGFIARALDAITPSSVPDNQEAGGNPMGAGDIPIPNAPSTPAPIAASTVDNPLYANTPLNPLLLDAVNKQNLKDGNLTQVGPTVAKAIQQRVDPEQVKIAKARAKSIDDLPETAPPISLTGVATNMFAGGAAGLSSAAAALSSVLQSQGTSAMAIGLSESQRTSSLSQMRETSAMYDGLAKDWRGTAEANGGKTMIGKVANIVGSIAPILAAPEGELPQLIAMTGLFGIPAFKDTLTSKLESGQPFDVAINHAVISFAINMAGPKLATDGANALFSQLAKNATPQSAAMVLKEMAKSAVTGAGFSAASTSIDKFVDEQYGQKNDNPYVDIADMGANALAFKLLRGASLIKNIRAERSQDAAVVQQADQAKQEALDKWSKLNFNKTNDVPNNIESSDTQPAIPRPAKEALSPADQLEAILPLKSFAKAEVKPEEVMQAKTLNDAVRVANEAAASPELDSIVENSDQRLNEPVQRAEIIKSEQPVPRETVEPTPEVTPAEAIPPEVRPAEVKPSETEPLPVESKPEASAEPSVIQLGQYGKAPRSGSTIELVRNNENGFDLYQSGKPALDFDSAEPIKYPEGTTVQEALADVKARQKELFGNSGRFYQAKGIDGAIDTSAPQDIAAPVEPKQYKDFANKDGQIKTFAKEKDANLYLRGNKSTTKGYTARNDDGAWVLTKEVKPRSEAQLKADARRNKDATTVYPTHDNLYTAIGKLGGLSQKEAVETWGSDPEEKRPTGVYNSPTLRYSGMTQKGRELGLSIDSMGEKLAELGYLPKDEHGKYDVRDFENAFRVGDEHYTPSGIERRAALSDEMRYQEEMAKYKESAQDIVDLVPEADNLDNANLHFALDASEKMAHDVDWSSLKLTDDSDFMRAMGFTEKEINEDRNQAVHQSEPGQSAGREQAESDQSNAKAGTETSREAGGREGQEVNLPRYDSEFSRANTASWVIREKGTGKVIAETFDRKKVEALNKDKYEAVPIVEHLSSLSNKPQTSAEPAKPQTHSDILREAADKMDALTNPTKAALEAKQREQEQAIADKAKSDKEAEQRLQADLDRNDFKLSGSNRPADVREANGQTPLFSRGNKEKPIFYSQMSRQIESLMGNAEPATQMLMKVEAWAKAGKFKQEELQWSGLTDWLKLQEGKVTKQQVKDYLDGNGVKVAETMLADDSPAKRMTVTYEDGDFPVVDSDGKVVRVFSTNAEANDFANKDNYSGVTKFSQYQLPGGENYRELLLTLPMKEPIRIESFEQYAKRVYSKSPEDMSDRLRYVAEQHYSETGDMAPNPVNAFKSSHFDQPNILAHVRFNERTDAEGKKVLFIEEIQSDWAQKGKKEGFGVWQDGAGGYSKDVGVPSAPFVGKTDAWVSLSLKRMIRYAVDNGFDKVAWANGEQQAARYDLSKQVKEIAWQKNLDGTYDIEADTERGEPIVQKHKTASELEDIIGKEPAQKIVDGVGAHAEQMTSLTRGRLSNLDLKVGGEGMKGFYDKIVPNVANDVLKKLGGGRVGEVALSNDSFNSKKGAEDDKLLSDLGVDVKGERPPTQPGFDITPKMREVASEGVPLFSRLKETENRNGLNNFHNDDVSLGRSRMAETQPAPKDGTHRAYDILDTPLLKTLDRSIPKDQRQAQAKVGDVLLSHDAEGNITSLKNIEIFPSKQGRTWGEKTVSSILASLPEGKTLKIEDIKPDAVGFWDKMGAKFPRSEHGMEADLSYQQYKDKYENRLADKERDFFNDGGTSGTPSFNRAGHEDSSGNQADRGRTGRRGENDSGLTVDAAREAAQPLLDKFPRLKSSIEFVKSADDVPHNAVANDARGVYVGDKIYVVADNIKNIAELTDVINHEGVGHLAVKEMLDQVKPGLHDELLKQVTLLDKSNNPIVREMADEIRETYSQPLKVPTLEESRAAATENNIKTLPGDTVKSILNRMELKGNLSADAENMVRMAKPIELNDKTVAAEVLAHMAERRMQNDEQFVGPIKGIVDRFVDALKSFGKLVFGKELSTKDLLNMLRLAENHLADSKYTGGILKASTVRAQEIMASRARESKQTDTPEFKKWFGDSKVVDAEGKPLVVYHGTPKGGFNSFEKSKNASNYNLMLGDGFYFTPDKSAAEHYTHGDATADVMQVYLSLKTPLVVNSVKEWHNTVFKARNSGTLYEQAQKSRLLDSNFLQELGHDGIVYRVDGSVREVVVFKPEQIKSAIGNNGNFDANNPDIRFSRAEALPREKPTEEEKSSVPIAVTKQSQDAVKELQLFLGPMAAGSDRARATTKDFANNERLARHTFAKFDEVIVKNFDEAQQGKMWTAADEQNELMLKGESTVGKGLDRLTPVERAFMDKMHDYGEALLQRAKAVGMFKGEGVPYWAPRMAVMIDESGEVSRISSGEKGNAAGPGGNVVTTASSLKQRKYVSSADTEAAMKAKFGDDATLVKNIRTMPLAMARLERAIAGRELIEAIKQVGKSVGEELTSDVKRDGFFTLEHSAAFHTYEPHFIEQDGKMVPAIDQNGDMVFLPKPIYISKEFEGPLNAVMSQQPGKVYTGLMNLKAKSMGVIMYSPLIHNAVEFGRALPVMPGKVLTLRIYFDGNKAKNDPAQMKAAILDGMVPIGHRAGLQDITGIIEDPNLIPGRSLTAKALAYPAGLISPEAAMAVKKGVDAAGDFWHNTLLWDRIGDLQMGIYKNIKEDYTQKLIRMGFSEEHSEYIAGKVAAHLANRYAGALPNEAMSSMARKIANLTLFSRSFTIGNLGVMKDMISGLPKDVQAQILRDVGELGLKAGLGIAKNKARSAFMMDIALMYAGNALLQSAFDYMKRDKSLNEIEQGYVDRFYALIKKAHENPLDVLNSPLSSATSLMPNSQNEPGKEERIHYGDEQDGTRQYFRFPVGKIGEEFTSFVGSPLEILKRKEGTMFRPIMQTLTNDEGFGQRVYNPDDKTISGSAKSIGRIVMNFMSQQVPADAITAAYDLARGKGDGTDLAKVVGPLVGITSSRGAPGGPEVGEIFNSERIQRGKQADIRMDVKRALKDGDIDKANELMESIGMTSKEISKKLGHIENPSSYDNRQARKKFDRQADEDAKARMDNYGR